MNAPDTTRLGTHDYRGKTYISISSIFDHSREMQTIIDQLDSKLPWRAKYVELAKRWNTLHPNHTLPVSTSGGGSLFAVYGISTSKVENIMLANIRTRLRIDLSSSSQNLERPISPEAPVVAMVDRVLTLPPRKILQEDIYPSIVMPGVSDIYDHYKKQGYPERSIEILRALLSTLSIGEKSGAIEITTKTRGRLAKGKLGEIVLQESDRDTFIDMITEYNNRQK